MCPSRWSRCISIFPDAKEYCLTDVFKAKCSAADEVVYIQSAMYGRMRAGGCVQKNYGYIGCQSDVTRVIATKCSARSRCEITNLEADLETYQHCPSDLKSYLDANYTCIKGRPEHSNITAKAIVIPLSLGCRHHHNHRLHPKHQHRYKRHYKHESDVVSSSPVAA